MKRFVPAKAKAEPKKMDVRTRAQAKAAQEKTAARGGNKRPAHKLYPHLD